MVFIQIIITHLFVECQLLVIILGILTGITVHISIHQATTSLTALNALHNKHEIHKAPGVKFRESGTMRLVGNRIILVLFSWKREGLFMREVIGISNRGLIKTIVPPQNTCRLSGLPILQQLVIHMLLTTVIIIDQVLNQLGVNQMTECLEIGVTLQSLIGLAEVIIGHLLVDLVLMKEGLLDITEVPATLKVIGVIGAPVAVVVQDTDILGTTVNLQILTVIPLLSNILGQGVVIETEGRVLIFPRLQLILGIRIGTHLYISLSVWPESMSGPQGRKVKD